MNNTRIIVCLKMVNCSSELVLKIVDGTDDDDYDEDNVLDSDEDVTIVSSNTKC